MAMSNLPNGTVIGGLREEPKSVAETEGLKPSERGYRLLALLTPPGAWTKGWFARDKNGLEVGPDSGQAVSFCLIGALTKLEESFDSTGEDELYNALSDDRVTTIAQKNDSFATQEEALSWIKGAISRLEARGL